MYQYVFSALMLLLCTSVRAQQDLPLDTTGQRVLPMSATSVDYRDGNRYYERGAKLPFTGILYGKYDNGAYLSMQQYVDGLGNGFWIDFDPDGKVSARGTYVNNRVEGPVTLYYEDGSVKAKGQYRHWKRPIGLWRYFNRAGTEVHRMTYTR